jgi:23S rRNA pseudouridine1911/1915/1917 synthase
MNSDPEIIFEDEVLLVINKPAGMVVNRAESVEKGTTVQDWVEQRFRIIDGGIWNHISTIQNPKSKIYYQRGGIAHRLDKDTSGCLVIAKTPEGLAEVMRQFKAREITKTYLALVHGKVEPKEGTWRLPISRSRYNRTEFVVDPFGKISETVYQVRGYYRKKGEPEKDGDIYTQLELQPKTGRTHQLRVHLKHLHHPLVGDEKYTSHNQYQADLKWCKRQFLHASGLRLSHPLDHKLLMFTVQLAPDLTKALECLEQL